MKKAIFENAAKLIKDICQADDYTLNIYSKDSHEIRFAQNGITQHISGSNTTINLNVAFGDRTGSASTNQIDENSLKSLVRKAENIAKINESDPEYISSPGKSQIENLNNSSKDTEDLSENVMIDNIKLCVKNAVDKDAKLSGISSKHLMEWYIATKNGFEGFDRFSEFSHSMTIKKDGVETKVSKGVKKYSDFDIKEEINQLNNQFDSLHNPDKFDAQKIAVILRPAAVENLFNFLFWMMNMRDSDEGTTPFTNQLNKKFFGEKFNLSSTFEDDSLVFQRFSEAGIPNRNIDWIKDGVIKNMPVSRFYAREKNIEPAMPVNVYISGGEISEEEMMKMVDRGLIINNFWYIRFIDKKRGELTGMTRDGVLYFENGKVVKSINNLRWNEVIQDVTRRILALGQSVLKSSDSKVPTMLIKDFNFVDSTSF